MSSPLAAVCWLSQVAWATAPVCHSRCHTVPAQQVHLYTAGMGLAHPRAMHASTHMLHGDMPAQTSSLNAAFCSVPPLAQGHAGTLLCNCRHHSSCTVVYAGQACCQLKPPHACPQVRLTEDEWLEKLGRQSFHILREEGTEFPNSRWACWQGCCKRRCGLLICRTGAVMHGAARALVLLLCADADTKQVRALHPLRASAGCAIVLVLYDQQAAQLQHASCWHKRCAQAVCCVAPCLSHAPHRL